MSSDNARGSAMPVPIYLSSFPGSVVGGGEVIEIMWPARVPERPSPTSPDSFHAIEATHRLGFVASPRTRSGARRSWDSEVEAYETRRSGNQKRYCSFCHRIDLSRSVGTVIRRRGCATCSVFQKPFCGLSCSAKATRSRRPWSCVNFPRCQALHGAILRIAARVIREGCPCIC